jgi:hypothetical protein
VPADAVALAIPSSAAQIAVADSVLLIRLPPLIDP